MNKTISKNKKNICILVMSFMAISLFSVFAYAEETKGIRPIIVHENTDNIQCIDTTNYELQSFINSIEDKEKREIIYEISITPVKEETKVYENDIELKQANLVSPDSIDGYKKLSQMSLEELKIKLDEINEMSVELNRNQDFFEEAYIPNTDNNIYAVVSYSKTMEHTKKDLLGNVMFGLRCKVDWNVSNGKIIYLGPTTTRLYNSSYTYYGSLRGTENLADNDTRGIVFKQQSFGPINSGITHTVALAGNCFTDGRLESHGSID